MKLWEFENRSFPVVHGNEPLNDLERSQSFLAYLPEVDIRWVQKQSRHRRKTSLFATREFNRRRCRQYIARIIYHRKKCNSCRGTKAGTTFMGTCHKQVLGVGRGHQHEMLPQSQDDFFVCGEGFFVQECFTEGFVKRWDT